jgi:two-component sensor histidine kinase
MLPLEAVMGNDVPGNFENRGRMAILRRMSSPQVPAPKNKILPGADLIRRYTTLGARERRHLESLVASWSLLADLSFSDMLLFVPVTHGAEREQVKSGLGLPGVETPEPVLESSADLSKEPSFGFSPEHGAFVILGQVRPTTSTTLYEADLVGELRRAASLPNTVKAHKTGQIVVTPDPIELAMGTAYVTDVPVGYLGSVLAVICGVFLPPHIRRRGTLEQVYSDLFDRLATMVGDGLFPFDDGDPAFEEAPRVGDGLLIIDEHQRITYASPNAVSALHRASIMSAILGSTFGGLGVETSVVERAFASKLPVIEEFERFPDIILTLRCIPLVAHGALTGAAILLRDVTDLRRKDRLLLSKDATIREVHHRVKNNLQTISSLLRLQARRLDDAEAAGRTALVEAERRIRAIALVHDILARDATEQVPFEEIVSALVNMSRETKTVSYPVLVDVDGSLGDVGAAVATSLAVVIAELLQNAMDHAFPESWCMGRLRTLGEPSDGGVSGEDVAPGAEAHVSLKLRRRHDTFEVTLSDNGCGLPKEFDFDKTRSLGLSIVRDLVRSQLAGTITMETGSEGGTTVVLQVPVSGEAD